VKNPKLIALFLSLSLATIPQLASAQTIIQKLFQQGNAAEDANRYSEAESIWRRILEIDPNNAVVYNNLGTALSWQGELDEAVEAYYKALSITDEDSIRYAVLNNMGIALSRQGKLADAVWAYQTAIKFNSKDAIVYNNLGIVLRNQGKLDEAVAAYQKAIQIYPQYDIAHNNLGIVLRNQGKLDEAVAAYQTALFINPNNPYLYYNLGLALSDQEKLDQAIAAYQKAIQLNPRYAAAYSNMDIALANQEKLNKAVGNYQPTVLSLEDRPGTPTSAYTLAYNGLGFALQQQGKLTKAITEYKKAIALDPNYVTAQNNLQEAERLLALQQNPPLPPQEIDDRQWVPTPQQEPLVRVLRSVVLIVAEIPTGNNIGAGWVVKRQRNTAWILTNRHVVTDIQGTNRPSKKIELEFYSQPPPGKFRPRHKAEIVQITDVNESLDLALLEVTGIPEDIQPLTMSSGNVQRTAEVIIIGHPSNGGDWTTELGRISNVISEENKLQITATLAEGNSGGPVINKETQQVVGLMVQINDSSRQRQDAVRSQAESSPPATGGFGFAYDMNIVIEKLRKWEIP
jgi:tetratricopeptide (TPR) repeat protein